MIVKYQAINRQGAMVADTLVAEDAAEAKAELMRRGLTPISIEDGERGGSKGASGAGLLSFLQREQTASPRKASKRQLPFFTAQMSILLETGTTVAASMGAIERQMVCPHWRELIACLRQHVEEGGSLASAVEGYPEVFDPLYGSMISAGETSGSLNDIFRRLADLSQQADRIRSKVVSAMIYPALLTTIAGGVLTVLIFFVLPRFETIFTEMNVDLPGSTKAFLALSHLVRENVLWMVIGVVAAITGVVYWVRSAQGKRCLNLVALKIPIVGTLVAALINARIFRLIGLLVTSNVSLVETLELAATSTSHQLFADMVVGMRESVLQGRSMYEVLQKSPLVPASISEMVRTGEENGKIGMVMNLLADYLDEQNETKVATLTSVMEPLILVVMGVVIGIVAISLVLPMFDMSRISA